MTRFDTYDLEVYKAHSLAEVDGAASFSEIAAHHDGPLPHQRVQGMARRGLLCRDENDFDLWCLTPEGVELANALRDQIAAERSLMSRRSFPTPARKQIRADLEAYFAPGRSS